LSKAIKKGLVASCHDCSDGGLGIALAETAFSGGFGITADLRNDYLLFSESQSRFVVTISPKSKDKFEEIMEGSIIRKVGSVTPGDTFTIIGIHGNIIVEENIDELKRVWQKPLNF